MTGNDTNDARKVSSLEMTQNTRVSVISGNDTKAYG